MFQAFGKPKERKLKTWKFKVGKEIVKIQAETKAEAEAILYNYVQLRK